MTANTVFIGLGSNTKPEQNLREAVHLLSQQVTIIKASAVYETAPIGGEGRNYLNAVVELKTDLNPADLKTQVLKNVENQLGRTRDSSGDVTIDLDILLFNDELYDLGKRQIPDPGILKYPHIAIPLAEIAPDLRHPITGQSLTDIANLLGTDQNITLQADIDLMATLK